MTPATWEYEASLWKTKHFIAGVDEAGRGPLAGPVVAAAVIFPPHTDIPWLDDCKRLASARREKYLPRIKESALAVGWAVVDSPEIDGGGILPATFKAMRQAIAKLGQLPDYVLVDGNIFPAGLGFDGEAIIKGDALCASIAAASIVAKVMRLSLIHISEPTRPY